MPQEGRRLVRYRPFVTCDDPKGVVECGTIRKFNKSNYQEMEPSSEARLLQKSSRKAFDKEELSRASLQLLEVSKGAQKLNHMIESWSKGITTEGQPKDIAKDLLKGALDLQESLMMLGKLQAASKYVAQLKRKQEKSENSGLPGDLGHGRESGFHRLEVCSRDESSRKKIEELREAIESSLAMQNQLNQRKFEAHLEIPSTSSSQSSADYEERVDSAPDNNSKGSNIIAKLMGLEEIYSKPVQQKLQDKISQQQKSSIDSNMSQLKKPHPGVQDREPDRKSLREILDNLQFNRFLKRNSISKAPVFSADNVPPIVLIKPSPGPRPESSEATLERKGASDAITVLKSQKLNEKFEGRRFDREEIACSSERINETRQVKEISGIASCQKRGSRCSKQEISTQGKAKNSERAPNMLRHPCPPANDQVKKEKHGMQSNEIEKVTESHRRSSEKANSKAKCMHRSEDQAEENVSVAALPENRPSRMKREVSPQRTQKSRQYRTKKEIPILEMQRSKNTVSNRQAQTSSQSCGDQKRSLRNTPPIIESEQLMAAKSDESNATQEGDDINIGSATQNDSVNLGMNAGNEDPQFNEENHDTSESVVAVSEACGGTANSPTFLSPSTAEPGTETDGQKLNTEFVETEDHIKLLLSSPSFQSHAEDSFTYSSDPPGTLQRPANVDSVSLKERLLTEYANELLDCGTVCGLTNSLRVVSPGSLRTQISLDNFLEEILKGIENLSSYCKLSSESLPMDGLYAKMKRDLSWHRGGAVSKLWDAGWTGGFYSEEVEHAVNEVEETILSSLMEETLTELVQ